MGKAYVRLMLRWGIPAVLGSILPLVSWAGDCATQGGSAWECPVPYVISWPTATPPLMVPPAEPTAEADIVPTPVVTAEPSASPTPTLEPSITSTPIPTPVSTPTPTPTAIPEPAPEERIETPQPSIEEPDADEAIEESAQLPETKPEKPAPNVLPKPSVEKELPKPTVPPLPITTTPKVLRSFTTFTDLVATGISWVTEQWL